MSEKTIEGITKIAVKGFKSIAEECEIDIRPLTILAGTNSSGKSSIMQPLLMLKQTLEAPYDPGPLLIDGPNVQFTEAAQFLSALPDENGTDRFQIQIETDNSDLVRTTFRKGPSELEIVEMMSERKFGSPLSPLRFTLYPEMSSAELKLMVDKNLDVKLSAELLKQLTSMIEQHFIPKDANVVKRSRCFLYVESSQNNYIPRGFTVNLILNMLTGIHLPGLRGNPERTYKFTSTGPLYPGTFENYVASILYEWQEKKDERLKTVTDALHILGLTGTVSTKKISDVGIELQVGRLPHDSTGEMDMVNIADVGFGVSQVLPIVVALTAAEQGRLVHLEQPELHLHPRAQVALAQVLADAAKRGVRVVAETHSSLLLLGVQTLVAEGDLSPELVKLHWFSRREDGVTEVNSADLDETGAYGEWPEDFADVSLHAQSSYIKAAQSRFIKGA